MYTKIQELYWTHTGSNIPQNSSCTATYLPSLKLFKSDKKDIQETAWDIRMNSKWTFAIGPYYTGEKILDDQVEFINDSPVETEDVVWKSCRVWWTIETNIEGNSGKSVLVAWHDENPDDIYIYRERERQTDRKGVRGRGRERGLHIINLITMTKESGKHSGDIQNTEQLFKPYKGLISSAYHDLHLWRSNKRPQNAGSKLYL